MIEQDELNPLLEKQAANNWLNIILGIFLAIAAFLSVTTFLDIVRIANDKTIPLVVCPRTFDLDRPVLMKTITSAPAKVKDAYIKGFVRKLVQSQFPRTADDAEQALKFLVSHSEGALASKFSGFLKNIELFKELIQSGYFYEFYPENSLDVRIRSTGRSGEWAVEVDGHMTKHVDKMELRTTPTLRYVIRTGDHTLTNPEGLYVVDGNLLDYIDYVSGRKGNE